VLELGRARAPGHVDGERGRPKNLPTSALRAPPMAADPPRTPEGSPSAQSARVPSQPQTHVDDEREEEVKGELHLLGRVGRPFPLLSSLGQQHRWPRSEDGGGSGVRPSLEKTHGAFTPG